MLQNAYVPTILEEYQKAFKMCRCCSFLSRFSIKHLALFVMVMEALRGSVKMF